MPRIRKFRKAIVYHIHCQAPGCEKIFTSPNSEAKYCYLCRVRMSRQAIGLEA